MSMTRHRGSHRGMLCLVTCVDDARAYSKNIYFLGTLSNFLNIFFEIRKQMHAKRASRARKRLHLTGGVQGAAPPEAPGF